MSPVVKYALPLAFVLPLGGFVAGSLVSAAQHDPDPRTPIVLREDSSETPATGMPRNKSTDPSRPSADTDDDDDGDDDDHVVRPEPVDDDEDDGDDAGEDEGGDGDEDGDDESS